jgi:p-hydroxybenzoate 3-monooxygenase
MLTQVGIVGAGPAGLLLAHLLRLEGIESVVLEARSREYVEQRVRAGVLEQGTVELLEAAGVGERMRRQGMVHHGIELRFGRRRHRVPLTDLTGRSITIYGQQEVVKDLIRARLDAGGEIVFEVDDVRPEAVDSDRPLVRYRHGGQEQELHCDLVAGCDGFHGVCRDAVPAAARSVYQHDYPYACARRSSPACTSRSTPTSRWSAGRTSGSGRSCRRGWGPTTAGRWGRGRSSRRASRRCAAS